MRRTLGIASLLLAALVVPACGGSGTYSAGTGGITLTSIAPSPLLGCSSQPFTITGSDFETLTGTTVQVTFRALGGATPFAAGTSATATVTGLVTSATTITGMSPEAVLCGVVSVSFEVDVALESGVRGSSTGLFTGTITAPVIGSIFPTSFPSEIPTGFTITGTGFGPAGTPVTVRITGDGGSTLFGDGTQQYFDVSGTVTSPTTITGVTPLAAVCGVDTATANMQVLFVDGCCSAPTGSGFVTFVAPTFTSTSAPSPDSEVPTAFTITGTGFPAVGTNITLRFVSTNPGTPSIFADGTATSIDLTGTVTSPTTITGITPVVASCFIGSATARVEGYFPGGSCEVTGAAFVTFFPPLIGSTSVPVVNALVPTAFTLTGSGFPAVAQNVTLRFSSVGGPIFADGTATSIDLTGTVTSPTTISGVTPAARICGVDSASAILEVYFPGGSCYQTGPAFQTFQRPSLATASPGGIRNLYLPTTLFPDNAIFSPAGGDPFELTALPGRDFGPAGSVVEVRFSTSAGITPFQGGSQNFDTVLCRVATSTTIRGTTPPSVSDGALPFSVDVQAFWEDGTCSDTTTAIYRATIQRTFAGSNVGAGITSIDQGGLGAPALIGVPVPGTAHSLDSRRNRLYALGGFLAGDVTIYHTEPTVAAAPTEPVSTSPITLTDPRDIAAAPDRGEIWVTDGLFNLLMVMHDSPSPVPTFIPTPAGSVPNRILYNEAADEMVVEFSGTGEIAIYGVDSQTLEALYTVSPGGPFLWNGVMALRPGSAADARAYFVLVDTIIVGTGALETLQLSTGVFTAGPITPGPGPGVPTAVAYDASRDLVVWDVAGAYTLHDPDTLVVLGGPVPTPSLNTFSLTIDPQDDRWYFSDNAGGIVFAWDPVVLAPVGGPFLVPGADRNVSTSP